MRRVPTKHSGMQRSLVRCQKLASLVEPSLKRAVCSSRFELQRHNEKIDKSSFIMCHLQTGFRQDRRCFSSTRKYLKEKQDIQTREEVSQKIESGEGNPEKKLSQAQRLRKIFAEYGTTAVVFHTCISLTSLGICYAAVSSGIDVPGILQRVGFSESVTNSTVASGASTFVIAYACHKVFVPVRMFLTITCTPLIVRKLRMLGILKVPVK